jgi:hypothetical protein
MEGSSVFANGSEQQRGHTATASNNGNNSSHVLKNRLYTDQPAGAGAVLGINAMLGYDILFDPEQGWIGWARANCAATDGDTTGRRTPVSKRP